MKKYRYDIAPPPPPPIVPDGPAVEYPDDESDDALT